MGEAGEPRRSLEPVRTPRHHLRVRRHFGPVGKAQEVREFAGQLHLMSYSDNLLVTVHIRFGTIQRRPTVTRPPQSDRSPGPKGISNCLLPLGRPGGSSYFHVPASGCARIRCRSQQHDLPINASSGRGEKVQATSDCLRKLLDTLRIRFGRIDSSEAPNTANDRADQLALSAACVDGLSLRKLLVPGLLR
jgi:hypothetical protein